MAAVQLAKAAGATVVAAASTSEKLRVCRDSGADLLLNYRESEGDWRGALKRLTGGRGIDVVVDNVGGLDCGVSIVFDVRNRTAVVLRRCVLDCL